MMADQAGDLVMIYDFNAVERWFMSKMEVLPANIYYEIMTWRKSVDLRMT